MNKKGSILYWIMIAALIASAFLVAVVFKTDFTAQPKGVWEESYLGVVQETEKELLLMDSAVYEVSREAAGEVIVDIGVNGLGCGVVHGIPVLKFSGCLENIDEKFVDVFSTKVLGYSEILIDGNDVVGISEEKKFIGSALETIPTEESGLGAPDYDFFLTKPFYVSYKYQPHFRIALDERIVELESVVKTADDLVFFCHKEEKLRACLDDLKPEEWRYGPCHAPDYGDAGREVAFCVGLGDEDFSFAVDFS